ncbi:glycine-rich domain-containing protein [Streptomyces sp. NPDC093225]|uniref:glycine-rich domain-containing protein n=1 Tax=Streptomyces sp. NPDC093225 TaxID=3366034 RepID=UPI0038201132
MTDCNVELRNHDHGRRPSPQELLGDAFPAVRNTLLAAHPGMSLGRAEMITAEAVKFVVASAQNPGVPLAPSRAVDTGWHALLLHTAAYAELCGRYGTFVHHLPGCDPRPGDPDSLRRARRAVEGAGFEAVEGLWRA